MKTVERIKIKDRICIDEPDKIVRWYLVSVIESGIEIQKLRVLCSIEKGKYYEVTDVCKGCKFVKIKVGKYYPLIRNEFISSIK